MGLKVDYLRRSGEIIGSVTSGFSDTSTTVRNVGGKILGHTSDRFNTTRDSSGKLVSTNAASPGLLTRKR